MTTTTTTTITEPRVCAKCAGTCLERCIFCNGKHGAPTPGIYNDKPCTWCGPETPGMRACRSCDGAPTYQPPVIGWLVDGVLASKGPRKGRLLRSRPPLSDHRNRESTRLYYVWRLARFHSGADCTLPMMAEMDIGGDPFRRELDAIAQLVARRLTGHSSIGAQRWSHAMHGDMTGAHDIDLMLATGEASE